VDEVLQAIVKEAAHANAKYGPPSSAHESLGVLIEEVMELQQGVHANDAEIVAAEAVQVAAVAYRLVLACQARESTFYRRSGFA
jgi:hypothetical protein